MEYKRISCQERNGQLCKFCEKDETTSAPLPTRRPYPDYGNLPNFHYLSWSATPTNGREPDDSQPRAQIRRLLEESELVSGDSEAIRKFSDKYIFPEKLVPEYVEHLSQIKMRKEKKKEETEREPMERLNREYNDIDWVGLYNSDKLSSLRVDELSLYFSHHKITFKEKKAEKKKTYLPQTKRILLRKPTFNYWNDIIKCLTNSQFSEILLHQSVNKLCEAHVKRSKYRVKNC